MPILKTKYRSAREKQQERVLLSDSSAFGREGTDAEKGVTEGAGVEERTSVFGVVKDIRIL